MSDYTIYYKDTLPVDGNWPAENQWDLFLSAFTSATRVQRVFDIADATQKHWLVFTEYGYTAANHPAGLVFAPAEPR